VQGQDRRKVDPFLGAEARKNRAGEAAFTGPRVLIHGVWGLSWLVSSFSCAALVRYPTDRAESQISSETNMIHCPYAQSVTSRHGSMRDVCSLPTHYPQSL
jgi:hypothetical protein